jgi:hypothetical protein
MRARLTMVLASVLSICLSACQPPTTKLGRLSPEQIKSEQLKQQQLVIRSNIDEHKRLDDVAHPLFKAAVPLCGSFVQSRSGIRFANIHSYSREYAEAARGLGFSDTIMVVSIARGSAAEAAGLRVGDRITSISGRPAPSGRTALRDLAARLTPPARRGASGASSLQARIVFGLRRASDSTPVSTGPQDLELSITADTVCAYGAAVARDKELNAWADGTNIVITTAMMRFAAREDELAVVVAHEIAHNAMRHIDAKKKNATFGALLGAILDVAAATQGVNTGGEFTSQGAQLGAMTFSQDFEREADHVGMYILARADHRTTTAADFWRRMAQESPGSIKFASSHPTTAERYLRLEQAAAEIEGKRAAGQPLLPELKVEPARRQ